MAARFSEWSHYIAYEYLLRVEIASVSKACTRTFHGEEPSVLFVPCAMYVETSEVTIFFCRV